MKRTVNFKIYQREEMFSKLPYTKIWDDSIDCEGYCCDEMTLEAIFTKFNINHPENYTGRSLSVGDVVELDGVLFLCDMIGWSKVNQINVTI